MKTMFFLDWGPFLSETLVVVGHTNAEIVEFLRRKANSPNAKVVIDAFEKKGRPRPDETSPFTFHLDGKTVLYFPTWAGDDEDLDTLVHETNHLIFDVFGGKGMREEAEACAYTQAYLFHEIRKTLRQILGVKSSMQEVHDAGNTADRTGTITRNKPSRFDETPTEEDDLSSINGCCCP